MTQTNVSPFAATSINHSRGAGRNARLSRLSEQSRLCCLKVRAERSYFKIISSYLTVKLDFCEEKYFMVINVGGRNSREVDLQVGVE